MVFSLLILLKIILTNKFEFIVLVSSNFIINQIIEDEFHESFGVNLI